MEFQVSYTLFLKEETKKIDTNEQKQKQKHRRLNVNANKKETTYK